ncbi:branched-chain amino acid ABC transporter permease [Aerosakkonema funiforme]|uniref:Branched-chain amino acid ABC transporter permease n=1 Tax=Aerosakkonema funiforme FACHB-1375 TaxID=2949571 RepID=A0A926ZHH1_9CYAN|nr:branched-chain amino acid ABC transporter permease [Aerosakkonema funiforme]MBD2180891.1 branched-chain amino acid ABC transporter permease [Aerosakkonema funiforme FACHB-1375]
MDISPGYLVSLTIFAAIYALFGLGLNLQWGFTGLINFGHVAFMTLGAYTTVLLSLQGVPLLIAPIAGAALAALLGLLMGISTLRLREDYLAIVTIGVSEVIRLIVNNEDLPIGKEWRSGVFGIQGFPLPLDTWNPNLLMKLLAIALLTAIAALALWQLWRWIDKEWRQAKSGGSTPIGSLLLGIAGAILGLVAYVAEAIALYNYTYKAGLMLLVLLVLTVIFWGLGRLVNSPWGRVLKAIREDEEVAKALGKNVFWYKLQSLMLGGAISGIAGAFYAWQLATVYPDSFQPQITFDAWTIVILGGAGNNVGTLLGAIIFWTYYEVTRFVLPGILPLDDARLGAFRIMVIGLLLIVLMMMRPQGILGKKEELTLGR